MISIADEYLETRVMTAAPEELHMMVIDGAVRYASQAESAMDEKDFEMAHSALNRAREFVAELIAGLNDEHNPDVVTELKGLFGHAYLCLAEADLHHDVEPIRVAAKCLRLHRDVWKQLIKERPMNGPDSDREPNRVIDSDSSGQSWTT